MKTVLYHADNDGFASAYAIWKNFKDEATYIPVTRSDEGLPDIPKETTHLYIVDFSYPLKVCKKLAKKYKLRIYDHHASAAKELKGFKHAMINTSRAACLMVWDAFHPGEEAPDLLKYVADYDTWAFALPDSVEINMYIDVLAADFNTWDYMTSSKDFVEFAGAYGKVLAIYRNRQILSVVSTARMMRLTIDDNTFEIPVANCSSFINEVGHELCARYPEAPFSATYVDRRDVRTWSLRTTREDLDVSIIAAYFGGGGHQKAAGFKTEIGWPQVHDDEFLKTFEEKAGPDQEEGTDEPVVQ